MPVEKKQSQTALEGDRFAPPKAMTATAYHKAGIFYRLWTSGTVYTDSGEDYYEQKYQERAVNNLQKRAKELGFEIVAQPSAVESVS